MSFRFPFWASGTRRYSLNLIGVNSLITCIRGLSFVLIGVVCVHIAASLKQVCDGLKMPFPCRAVQRCGPVCIAHAVAREQNPKRCQIASLRRLDEFLPRVSHFESTPWSSVRVRPAVPVEPQVRWLGLIVCSC